MLETSNKVAVHTRAQAGPTTFSPSHTEGKTRGAVLIFSRKERRKREEIAILLFLSLPCFSRKQGGGDWRLWEEERPAVWARACARPADLRYFVSSFITDLISSFMPFTFLPSCKYIFLTSPVLIIRKKSNFDHPTIARV